jgi:hypothetical protein
MIIRYRLGQWEVMRRGKGRKGSGLLLKGRESGEVGQARSSSKFCLVKMLGSRFYINSIKMILRS